MDVFNDAEVIVCADAAQWESWLAAHHEQPGGVWLKIAKQGSGKGRSRSGKRSISRCAMGGSIVNAPPTMRPVICNGTHVDVRRAHGPSATVTALRHSWQRDVYEHLASPRSAPPRQMDDGLRPTSRNGLPVSHPILRLPSNRTKGPKASSIG